VTTSGAHRQDRVERRDLRYVGQLDLAPVVHDAPAERRVQAEKGLEPRGLAGAVATHDHEQAAGVHAQIDGRQDRRAIADGQTLARDQVAVALAHGGLRQGTED
jgi:hypothetical protein